jgi:hypothetical protein
LVNEKDQYRLAQIEALIGDPIPKLPLPPELGAGPAWNPRKPSGNSNWKGKKSFRR